MIRSATVPLRGKSPIPTRKRRRPVLTARGHSPVPIPSITRRPAAATKTATTATATTATATTATATTATATTATATATAGATTRTTARPVGRGGPCLSASLRDLAAVVVAVADTPRCRPAIPAFRRECSFRRS